MFEQFKWPLLIFIFLSLQLLPSLPLFPTSFHVADDDIDEPKLTLKMSGSSMVGLVRENDRSQFDCVIIANPPHTELGWTFNRVPIQYSGTKIFRKFKILLSTL